MQVPSCTCENRRITVSFWTPPSRILRAELIANLLGVHTQDSRDDFGVSPPAALIASGIKHHEGLRYRWVSVRVEQYLGSTVPYSTLPVEIDLIFRQEFPPVIPEA